MLLAAGTATLRADETATAAAPLREAVETGSSQPARFVMADGSTVVGRIIRVEGETLTLRRPSGGLRTLDLADIVGVNIKSADGELLRGRIMRMADGGIGWRPDDGTPPNLQTADAEADLNAKSGGPLIRLDEGRLDRMEARSAEEDVGNVEDVAVTPPDVDEPVAVTPRSVDSADAPPIRLVVTADKAREDDRLMYFRLTLSEPPERSILVIYTMIDDTAVAPGDYTHRQGVVVFEPGETQAVVATALVNDEAQEGNERFTFFVTADPSAVTINQRKVVATIEDDDG